MVSGCMQQAVLENDVRSAQWKARTLSTASDTSLGYAALCSQLIELEALYQRDPNDRRVSALLVRGYELMARAFIELRRLEAVVAGDEARAAQEAQLAADATARAAYYRSRAAGPWPPLEVSRALAGAAKACDAHDRAAYERELNVALRAPERGVEMRLERALTQRLAGAWLMPQVAARCGF
ncbi:MAG TPA: hypothetical protein VEQ59_07815 [Polyangiaceae bacterium]|nr:hypothetical protein [Polyangiaceae bacterium]